MAIHLNEGIYTPNYGYRVACGNCIIIVNIVHVQTSKRAYRAQD